jgi:sugar lactone lactonase YvrE
MPAKHTVDAKVRTLMTGLAMGESPRWHEGRLWLADWGAQEILAINIQGKSDVVVRVPFALPFCIDWLLNGTLLIVSGREGVLMRRERDGSLVTHADLHGFSGNGWNEIVVDGRGNAYMNRAPGIALLTHGICIDAENAVWYADVPNKRCVRVREGGEVLHIVNADRGCFACMLGGPDRRTLFMIVTEWRGMEKFAEVSQARTGQVLAIEAPARGVGWP